MSVNMSAIGHRPVRREAPRHEILLVHGQEAVDQVALPLAVVDDESGGLVLGAELVDLGLLLSSRDQGAVGPDGDVVLPEPEPIDDGGGDDPDVLESARSPDSHLRWPSVGDRGMHWWNIPRRITGVQVSRVQVTGVSVGPGVVVWVTS